MRDQRIIFFSNLGALILSLSLTHRMASPPPRGYMTKSEEMFALMAQQMGDMRGMHGMMGGMALYWVLGTVILVLLVVLVVKLILKH